MKPAINRYVAIVGSRTAPEIVLEYMIRLGRTYTDLGIGVSSGDAYDCDKAGWYGAQQSRNFSNALPRIYLNKSRRNGIPIEQLPGFIDARTLVEHRDMATAMALAARGSFHGLNEFGRDLHIRNVYQIHGEDLLTPVMACILWAEPDGPNRVKGGTNTAFQIAKKAEIPLIVNLYHQEGIEWAKAFLKVHERDYPYIDIDWKQIHKWDDPRLTDFED